MQPQMGPSQGQRLWPLVASTRNEMWFEYSGPYPRLPAAGGRVCNPSSFWEWAGDHRYLGEPGGGQGWRNRLLIVQEGLYTNILSLQDRYPFPQLPCPLPVASSWDLGTGTGHLAGGVGWEDARESQTPVYLQHHVEGSMVTGSWPSTTSRL